jgi:5-hydroxyisourate hydrolase
MKPMSRLTTHVLDTALGRPAEGMLIELYDMAGERRLLASAHTNADGRCDALLLTDEQFSTGSFELLFHAGDYLREQHANLPDPLFLDRVPIRFGIADAQAHYHVPLLISPFAYSTYRGS